MSSWWCAMENEVPGKDSKGILWRNLRTPAMNLRWTLRTSNPSRPNDHVRVLPPRMTSRKRRKQGSLRNPVWRLLSTLSLKPSSVPRGRRIHHSKARATSFLPRASVNVGVDANVSVSSACNDTLDTEDWFVVSAIATGTSIFTRRRGHV